MKKPDMQILLSIMKERLVKRDNISKKEAEIIIANQLSIDEKAGYADFIINNENSIEETKKQVKDLWEKLKKIQKDQKLTGKK